MTKINRYKTRQINVGGVKIGGDAKISVQSMTFSKTRETQATLEQINRLYFAGADLVRCAVFNKEDIEGLRQIKKQSPLPIVADIHFNFTYAVEVAKFVDAVRINPGNIGSRDRVEKVVNACREKGTAIRIGVNTGSLPKDLAEQVEQNLITRAKALAQTAARESQVFEELKFDQYVVSMKASSVQETILSNEEFARHYDVPLHIGVTEAGPLISGVVKSTLAFSKLLCEGIGSTIRVSLSSSPENEIITGREILHECGLKRGGVTLISCPRCGRLGFDVHGFVERWQNELLSLDKNITVAVMGCVVNGPGEAKHADLGIAGAGDKAIIFKKGKIVRTIESKNADTEFRQELYSL